MRRLALLSALLTALPLTQVPQAMAPAAAATCSDPDWASSQPDAMWTQGRYIVHNNMWNAGAYRVSQRVAACSHANWRVTARADNRSRDGAVKTYPNVHRDYHDWGTGAEPRLRSFTRLTSTFAARSPHVGIYNVAYDIWLNGVADDNSTEVMIWTENYHQVPAGSRVARGLSFAGRTWRLFATPGNHYLAFVPNQPLKKGTLNLKRMLGWLVAHDRLPRRSTLGQICYGVEIVSTGGSRATFKVGAFNVRSRRG
jgi:hypothetical protein